MFGAIGVGLRSICSFCSLDGLSKDDLWGRALRGTIGEMVASPFEICSLSAPLVYGMFAGSFDGVGMSLLSFALCSMDVPVVKGILDGVCSDIGRGISALEPRCWVLLR